VLSIQTVVRALNMNKARDKRGLHLFLDKNRVSECSGSPLSAGVSAIIVQ